MPREKMPRPVDRAAEKDEDFHDQDTAELLVITDKFRQLVVPDVEEAEENPGFDPYNNSKKQ